MTKFNEVNFEFHPHASYSLDLETSDYFLFPNLKKCFNAEIFNSSDALSTQTNVHSVDLNKDSYLEG